MRPVTEQMRAEALADALRRLTGSAPLPAVLERQAERQAEAVRPGPVPARLTVAVDGPRWTDDGGPSVGCWASMPAGRRRMLLAGGSQPVAALVVLAVVGGPCAPSWLPLAALGLTAGGLVAACSAAVGTGRAGRAVVGLGLVLVAPVVLVALTAAALVALLVRLCGPLAELLATVAALVVTVLVLLLALGLVGGGAAC